ncbi:MAG: hypothetical protein ACRC1J_08220, partial [Sandaracinobacteroides sp.]
KARAMTRHLRSGFDEMMRQAELEEMEKQWAEHNRQIMAQTPPAQAFDVPDHSPPADAAADAAADAPAADLPAADMPAADMPAIRDPRPLP